MVNADLHIHSLYSSDGEFNVDEIIKRCKTQKVNVFSLTDHNSVKGIQEASSLSMQEGMYFIPSIEIDCNYEGTDLHVLGYQIDWKSPDFFKLEEDIHNKVMDSFSEMISNLNRLGFIIDTQAVLDKAEGKLPSAELIAEVMLSDKKYHTPLLTPYMEGGNRSDMPYINFYLDYFAQGKPAFVPIDYMSYDTAIEIIKDNGGIPIIAHPGLNFNRKEKVVEELLNKGAKGLEVFNNYHSTEQIAYFASLTQENKCLMTCGSDFHGKTKPLINIGVFKYDSRYEDYLTGSINRIKDNNTN
ncbi:MAG: PHP domain-containing protein [Prevotella sp.]|nr:PHP domain-containing protein [Prevotella sp.]